MGIIRVPGIKDTPAKFRQALWYIANRNGWNVDAIATMISHESRFQADAKNPRGSAIGLLQWTTGGAKLSGTTVEALAGMGAAEQLIYVENYYKRMIGKTSPANIADYMLLGWGRADAVGKPDDYMLAGEHDAMTAGAYRHNRELDKGGDGKITVGDLRASFWSIYNRAGGKRTDETEVGMLRMRPLIPKTYLWIDLVGPKRGVFDYWASQNRNTVKVTKIEATSPSGGALEQFLPAGSMLDALSKITEWFSSPSIGQVEMVWILFETTDPNVSFSKELGIPTLAPKGAATEKSDTVDVGEQPNPRDLIRELMEGALAPLEEAAKASAGLVIGGLVVATAVAAIIRFASGGKGRT